MPNQQLRIEQLAPGTGNADKVPQVNPAGTGFELDFVGGAGGTTDNIVTTSGPYTAAAGDFLKVFATSANAAIALPATPPSGSQVTVKRMDGTGAYSVIVTPNGGATVDGDANAIIYSQYTTVTFSYDGTNWLTKSTARDDPESGATREVNDRMWAPASTSVSIDEFNNESLDANWVRVDSVGGAGRAVWTEGGDVLSARVEGGDAAAELHAMMRPLSSAGGAMSPGVAFVTCVRTLGPYNTNYTMGGLVIADGITYGSGTQVVSLDFINTGGETHDLRNFTGYSTNPASVAGVVLPPSHPVFVRIVMTAANTWRRDWSSDGVTWVLGTATQTTTLTPAYVGVHCSSWGTATKGITNYQFLRRQTGIS
jgi:hypothetical protein